MRGVVRRVRSLNQNACGWRRSLFFDISFVAKHSIYQGVRPVPGSTIIDLSCSEQQHLLFELRRARFGYWLALHIILLCAAGYTPSQIAAVWFCSRSSVYRAVNAYRGGSLAGLNDAEQPRRADSLTPSLRRVVADFAQAR